MKIVLYLPQIALLLCVLSQNTKAIGYSDGQKLDTENAISEIEDHLHAIENDDSLPSSEEQSAYKNHFASHNNSLDSVSDFADGRHGEAHHSSKINEGHSESHDHHEMEHGTHHGRD
jgi:hypothetical protein